MQNNYRSLEVIPAGLPDRDVYAMTVFLSEGHSHSTQIGLRRVLEVDRGDDGFSDLRVAVIVGKHVCRPDTF